MEIANFLASIWGLYLVFMPLSLLVNPKHIKNIFSVMENEASAYICGTICFILGTATVLLNNTWAYDWKTIVTVLGWVSIIKGLFLLFWTQGAINFYSRVKDKEWLSFGLLALSFVGLVSVYFGFVGK